MTAEIEAEETQNINERPDSHIKEKNFREVIAAGWWPTAIAILKDPVGEVELIFIVGDSHTRWVEIRRKTRKSVKISN